MEEAMSTKSVQKVPFSDDERDRSRQYAADAAILADVRRSTDHARDVALDMLAMLAATDDAGEDFDDEPVTAPGLAIAPPSTAGDAADEKTSPDALAGLSLHELLELAL
jgi:hypothetical protein